MAEAPDDNIDDGPFKPWERKAIRRIINNQARVDWFWASARRWAFWGAACTGAAWSVYEHVIEKFFWIKKP